MAVRTTFLPIIQRQKLPLDSLAQLAEIDPTDRVTYGNQHLSPHLRQHAFVDGDIDVALGFGGIAQNAWCQRRHAVEPMWQDAKRTLSGLRYDMGHIVYLGRKYEKAVGS